ncbi:hypothetical protein VTN00DRAFT_10083 [Thermoascus crustaceus]|uniref:uncharacterized protein n=1 Tax=Thermoascus crustaceus TaxID=5088 RepID=UPI0037448415
MAGNQAALAYHEPAIATILNHSGFILVLNVVNSLLDKLVYYGLIGQLFIGILWGTPGANWLDQHMQEVIQKLGYLGLIVLVYEGGLSTSFSSLRANLVVSVFVALTGIGAPIALSFVLLRLLSATPLQAFAAGAALSATSLGTTFTILTTTGLIKTRLGVVTTSAAMLDDVVGLVMVQVITNLGKGGSAESSFNATMVVRPIFVSIGFAVGVVLVCKFVFKPLLNMFLSSKDPVPRIMKTFHFAFLAHTCVLVGLVAGATYAGTSSLFAAYLAGAVISWFDEISGLATGSKPEEAPAPGATDGNTERGSANVEVREQPVNRRARSHDRADSENISSSSTEESSDPMPNSSPREVPTGELVYERYYKDPLNRLLKPLFFASIGFAIPITEMFHGETVWRGIVYAILMAFGKLITGLWLVRISLGPICIYPLWKKLKSIPFVDLIFCAVILRNKAKEKAAGDKRRQDPKTAQDQKQKHGEKDNKERDSKSSSERPDGETSTPSQEAATSTERASSPSLSLPPKPKSLYPPSILGLAMVARGEIGYLIASLAETNGIFVQSSSNGGRSSEIYLVVIWAITLCTLVGPISVGTLVKRVKKLQKQRERSGGSDPLGVWGI